jgi:hypothetical protein
MRTLSLMTFGFLVGLILFNYDLKLAGKALEDEARQLTAAIQDESDFVALMRAEVSHLSRPGRIDALARTHLKFEPVTPQQTIPLRAINIPAVRAQNWQPETAPQPRPNDGIAALINRTATSAAPAPRAE